MSRAWPSWVSVCALLACDAYTEKRDRGDPSPPPSAAEDAGPGTDDAALDPCALRQTYPPGPYGRAVGTRIENLSFVGLDNAPFDFASLHADCTRTLLLVSTSAGWCTACREEQPKLQSLYENFSASGLVVVVTLFEDDDFETAVLRDVEAWQRRYDLTFPVVLDAPFVLGDYYDRNSTPMNMLVDLRTMEIVTIQIGAVDSTFETILEAKL